MKTIRIETNYVNPEPIPSHTAFVWETTAKTAKKAMSNIRAQIHAALGVPFCAIVTTYWKTV